MPTVAESAVPGFESVSWGGVMAPGGTPPAVVNKLNAEIVRILKLPDMQERLQALGAEVVGSSPAEFSAYLASEIRPLEQSRESGEREARLNAGLRIEDRGLSSIASTSASIPHPCSSILNLT